MQLKKSASYLTASASAVVKPLLSFLFLIDSAMARADEFDDQFEANLIRYSIIEALVVTMSQHCC
jgi:hypothetical protein